jgi:hypothetical protein
MEFSEVNQAGEKNSGSLDHCGGLLSHTRVGYNNLRNDLARNCFDDHHSHDLDHNLPNDYHEDDKHSLYHDYEDDNHAHYHDLAV